MEELKKYSPWEYDEEEQEDEEQPDTNPDGTPKDPNAEDEDPAKKTEDEFADDAPVKVKIDGKIVTMTAKELSEGYMRHSDYTRKTQDLADKMKNATPEEKKEVKDKANEIVENPEKFTDEDVNTAKYLLKVIKGTGIAKEFGLLTREELDAEKAKEKQVAEFSTKLDSAKTEIGKMTVSYQENGKTVKFAMPAWDEEAVLNHMQETGIHDPKVAYLNMHDAEYRNFIIKQSKGDTSYRSDKGGKKVEPQEKVVDLRSEEGHRSFIADEIAKLKDK